MIGTGDEELQEIFLKQQKPVIKIVGTGGAGNNTVSRLMDFEMEDVQIIAVNTDAQDLAHAKANEKILIGRDTTKGLGAGNQPKVGAEATQENLQEIVKSIQGADLLFITCGLGGGTGTGSIPLIAEAAKKAGMLVLAVVTMPFGLEGKIRHENALEGLAKLKEHADTIVVIPNDRLLQLVPNVPIKDAFMVADEILVNTVKGIIELVINEGLVNLDFADVRTVIKDAGFALVGVGESDSENRAADAVSKAINNPLIGIDINNAKRALINISAGTNLTLDEANLVVRTVSDRLAPDATIIWGAQISQELGKTLRATVLVTGIDPQHIVSKSTKKEKQPPRFNELGIEEIVPL